MRLQYASIFAVVLVILWGMPLLSGGSITLNYAYAKYENTPTFCLVGVVAAL